jgi:hypothetical protein
VWTLLGGWIRGITYREYEWMEAAGREQVPVLVLKHVILFALVVVGIVVHYRVHRLLRTEAAAEPGNTD